MIKKERDYLCIGLFLHRDKINGVIELFAVSVALKKIYQKLERINEIIERKRQF